MLLCCVHDFSPTCAYVGADSYHGAYDVVNDCAFADALDYAHAHDHDCAQDDSDFYSYECECVYDYSSGDSSYYDYNYYDVCSV